MLNPAAVCVFCASSAETPAAVRAAGAETGRVIARAGLGLVYGGTTCGLMLTVAEACQRAGGRVTGVVPQFMIEHGMAWQGCDELIRADDMRDRKAKMHAAAGGFLVLPGGIGTFDELFEAIALRQLDLHRKPIVLIDIDGYWQPLRAMFERGVATRTIRPQHLGLFSLAPTAHEALQALLAEAAAPPDPVAKLPLRG